MTVQDWLGKDNELGQTIWEKKYRYENETFDEWLDRVSGGNEEIRQLIVEKKFLFGGRILAGRGLASKGIKNSLSNCYVISAPEDAIESIYECATKMARTYSYGGGCGTRLSKLSPRGARIRNAAKQTTGAVSFMELFSTTTGLIGANNRRGALMLSLAIDHPDVEEFVKVKRDLEKITKANISVESTSAFMKACVEDQEFTLSFTREATGEKIEKRLRARDLLHEIAVSNWMSGEPGMLFWDRIESWNLLANTKEFVFGGVNPCGEMPLPSGGSCLLGALNLSEFVKDKQFDFQEFAKAIEISVIALNDVLLEGLPLHPLAEQRESVAKWRQIGLGIMGAADAFLKMEIRYGSQASLDMIDKIGKVWINIAIYASARLAEDPTYRCAALPVEELVETEFYKHNVEPGSAADLMVRKVGYLANSQLLTIAPTGSISTMWNVSGGAEPVFANHYMRKTESLYNEDKFYKVYTPLVKKYMDENKIDKEEDLPDFFVTAPQIHYTERIAVQGIWQSHVDAAISSTVNLPNEVSVEDIEKLYVEAWKWGLKGITVFRDGCDRVPILSTEKKEVPLAPKLRWGETLKVNNNVIGKKRKLTTGCGSLHCTAFFDPDTGRLLETYLSKGSTGGCNNFMIGLSRMISLSARSGCSVEKIVDQLNSSGVCPSYAVRTATKGDTSKGACCPIAVGIVLMEMWKELQQELAEKRRGAASTKPAEQEVEPQAVPIPTAKKKEFICPECGEKISFEGGCNLCKNCGWSMCS